MKIKHGLAILVSVAVLLMFGCAEEKGTPVVAPSKAHTKAYTTCYCGKLGRTCPQCESK